MCIVSANMVTFCYLSLQARDKNFGAKVKLTDVIGEFKTLIGEK